MIRASRLILLYFVIGSVMFGGGAVTWDNSGPTQYFVTLDSHGVSPADQPTDQAEGISGMITNLLGSFTGMALIVWNLFTGLVAWMNWPLFVFMDSGAPTEVTVLLGGSLTAMFYMSVVRLVKSSA